MQLWWKVTVKLSAMGTTSGDADPRRFCLDDRHEALMAIYLGAMPLPDKTPCIQI
jgi:hypothetical protein